MSLAGSWKKIKVDNGLAFGKAIGASDEQLAKQAKATSTVTYEINGNNIKVTRVHTIDGNAMVNNLTNLFVHLKLIYHVYRKRKTQPLSVRRASSTPKATKSRPSSAVMPAHLSSRPSPAGPMPPPRSSAVN